MHRPPPCALVEVSGAGGFYVCRTSVVKRNNTIGTRLRAFIKSRLGQVLPRTTERPVRKRGDECSDLPVRAVPQSHGHKSVVRGLLPLDNMY